MGRGSQGARWGSLEPSFDAPRTRNSHMRSMAMSFKMRPHWEATITMSPFQGLFDARKALFAIGVTRTYDSASQR
jgi:hypothetical protein